MFSSYVALIARTTNMGLIEVTMQHMDLGMKSIVLESCMGTGDWPSAFRARLFLVLLPRNPHPTHEGVVPPLERCPLHS